VINLIIGNCRYIFRSRMIFLILIFSTLVHVAGLKFVSHLKSKKCMQLCFYNCLLGLASQLFTEFGWLLMLTEENGAF